MTEEKTCYNCGNKNCNVYYSIVKKDYKRHFEIYEYEDFNCVNHDKWKELKVEETRTDKMTDEEMAEEYRESITQRLFNEDDVEGAWQRGAEFGYNKAFVEADKNLKAVVADFNKRNAKAKEIIKELLKALDGRSGFDEDVFKQAEQFLKEIE